MAAEDLLLTSWRTPPCGGCLSVVVGRKASVDGSVLVGHNEENRGERLVNFCRVPRRHPASGSVRPLALSGELPAVDETWAYLWSENRGLQYSDSFLNEWGVAVTSNSCPTCEDDHDTLAARGEIRDGGIGLLLRQLVAQRARTAREGVGLMGSLVQRFGYIGSGRTYVLADPLEAWLVAVIRGRRWMAQRVPDDVVVVVPNVFVFEPFSPENIQRLSTSPDLVDYAISRGWYDPTNGQPLDLRAVYQAEDRRGPDPRQWWAQRLITGDPAPWPPPMPQPFAVRPARRMAVADVAAVLRDQTGPKPLFQLDTQESGVCQLRHDLPVEIGCVWWRTTGRPDTSVLTPWHLGITEVPTQYCEAVDLDRQLTLEHHLRLPEGPLPRDLNLAWWKFLTLQELVDQDYRARIDRVRPAWAAIEEHLFAEQSAVEQEALTFWPTDPGISRDLLTQYAAEVAEMVCGEADELVSTLRSGAAAGRP